MVNNLVVEGFLTREKLSAARYVYKITDKGVEAVNNYECVPECLEI